MPKRCAKSGESLPVPGVLAALLRLPLGDETLTMNWFGVGVVEDGRPDEVAEVGARGLGFEEK
jgi:hypothetical protein